MSGYGRQVTKTDMSKELTQSRIDPRVELTTRKFGSDRQANKSTLQCHTGKELTG